MCQRYWRYKRMRRCRKGAKQMASENDLKARLRAFWDNHEPYWDLLESEASLASPDRQRACEFIPKGAKVLDLGCGNGANGRWLTDRCQYVGTDISLTALRRAICDAASLVCGDAENLPYRDDAFDAVIATFVLEHLVNPRQTFQEIWRVVRPNGLIVLLGGAWDFPFWYPNSLPGPKQMVAPCLHQ